jgi:signal transduction protein with GAF and PtsI domain
VSRRNESEATKSLHGYLCQEKYKRSYHHAEVSHVEVSATWRKLAPCLRTISSAKRTGAMKISALSAAVYKEDMLHTIEASEGVARASKSEVPARVPKTNKIPSTVRVR